MMSGSWSNPWRLSILRMIPRSLLPRAAKLRLQLQHILGPAHEGQADDIGVFGDKIEIAPVFFGHRADAEIGLREIDAFAGTELRLALAAVCTISTSM